MGHRNLSLQIYVHLYYALRLEGEPPISCELEKLFGLFLHYNASVSSPSFGVAIASVRGSNLQLHFLDFLSTFPGALPYRPRHFFNLALIAYNFAA